MPLTVDETPDNQRIESSSEKSDRQQEKNATFYCREESADEDSSTAWAACVQKIKEIDEASVREWKEEIDTLLVFAGLFSAVLTTFNVQSYVSLQPDSSDTSNILLAQISAQLNSFSVNSGFVNSSQPPLSATPPFRPSMSAVVINVLWFSSLISSLAAASIGILVKQWLNRYSRGLSIVSREGARVRQFRYDALIKYRVINIMALLPVLLQISLVLFLAGLLVLLWPLHRTVAAIATVLVAFLLVFLIITTILPAFAGDCPYQSPQAWGFLVMVQTTQSAIRGCSVFITDHLPGRLAVNSRFRRAIGQRLYAAIAKKISQSWRVRERNLIRKSQSVLDWHLLAAADAVVIDDAFLRDVVRPCFADIELDAEAATSSFYDIVQRRTDLFDDAPLWKNEPLWMLAMQYGGSRGGESALQSNQILVDLALDILFKAPKHGGSMQDIQHYLEHQAAYTPDVVLAGICRRLSSGVLAEGNGVCDMGVDLLLRLFSPRRQWVVGSNGFKALASLVLHRPGNIHRYLQICRVAFDVASHLAAPNYQYEHVRDEVRAMFAAFIQALGTAKWETIDDIGDIVRNLSAILPRIPNLAYRDALLITPDAIHVLDEAVKALLARMVVGRERDIFLKDGTETIQNLHSIYSQSWEENRRL